MSDAPPDDRLGRLRSRLTGSTVLMVASRPSTIALADDVVFVADGRIAAHGPHDELLDSTPAYRELVEAFESDRTGAVVPGNVEFGSPTAVVPAEPFGP